MIIRLPIDIKSLYMNIKNDNERGHTATVATPLKQYGAVHEDLLPILNIPENINSNSRENLIGSILKHSRAEAKITNVFVFERLCVNGINITDVPSFSIYIREEISPENVHCGRQKIHYPTTLNYEDSETDINNRTVMKAVSDLLHNYAFIVEAFEYDTETAVLNFDATIVGENDIPYSKVFINRRGVGNKFASVFNEGADIYDSEIIALREKLGYENVTPLNFSEIMDKNKLIALEEARAFLQGIGAKDIRNFYEEYPYSLYDLEYRLGEKKYYAIVRHTATSYKCFQLPLSKVQFCSDFSECAEMLLVTDVLDKPKLFVYRIDDLNKMKKRINSISYEDTEDY